MLCKISLDKISLGKNTLVRLYLACDGRIFFFHLTLFLLGEANLSSTFTQMSVIRTLGTVILAAIWRKNSFDEKFSSHRKYRSHQK